MNRNIARALLAVLLAGCASEQPAPAKPQAEHVERIGNLLTTGVPPVPAALDARLRQYLNTRYARMRGWVGDSILIATRFGQTDQLHRVDSPMAAREQITFFDEPVGEVAVPPPGTAKGFVYARDVGGSEFYQLFWYDWADGSSRMVTDGRSRYGNVVWDRAGVHFAYTTTERNGTNWDIHLQDTEGHRRVLLETDHGAWAPQDFSPDGSRLLVGRYESINESYLYVLDIESGELTPVVDEALKVAIGAARFSGDGRGVYFTSDMGAEFMRLHYKNLATGDVDVLTADVPWDVEDFTLSADGKRLALTANENGVSRLSVWRLPEHAPLALPAVPAGVITDLAFSADGTSIAFSLDRPNAPADVFTVSLTERQLVRWTESEVGGLDTANLTVPSLIEYPTFDSVTGGQPRHIPAYVYEPQDAGPHPVVVYIHGGPESQYRPDFSAPIQFMLNELGIAVIAPNVRGSAGYGKSYLKLDNGVLREDSVKDIGALLDWIGHQPDLDAGRVVVMGGSYGGYMVLASLVHYSDRLAAGIEAVGISNFVTFLTNTQDYRRDLRRAEYGDERDPAMRRFLEEISPLNHVSEIRRPLLIAQGANDPRVPASESEQIRDALQSAGTSVWYILAEDEGHGFRKKANRDYYTAAVMLFLEEYAKQ